MPLPSPYNSRSSQNELWKQHFGPATYTLCESVLREVCNAFLFNDDSIFQFRPDDHVASIYRACHPRWKIWDWGDSMELEQLTHNLEKRLGIELQQEISDVTLGAIVEMALERQSEAGSE